MVVTVIPLEVLVSVVLAVQEVAALPAALQSILLAPVLDIRVRQDQHNKVIQVALELQITQLIVQAVAVAEQVV
jgi:hypothetical protein